MSFIQRLPTKNLLLHLLYWLTAILLCSILSWLFFQNIKLTIGLIGFTGLTFALYKKPTLGLYLILMLPVIGELYRLPIGPDKGIIISDLFIPYYLAIWGSKKFFNHEKFPQHPIFLPWLIFIIIAFFSLLQALTYLPTNEIISSSLYLVRFIEYTLLFYPAFDLFQKSPQKNTRIINFVMISGATIAILGFLQLWLYPDLLELAKEGGWDPHINRLVSTWLDPNFVGGLFAFLTTIALGKLMFSKKRNEQVFLISICSILITALFFTYSRSAYLALAVGIFIIGILKSRKLMIICAAIFLLGISISPRALQRITDLAYSVSSVLTNTAENPDATARLRIKNWEQTITLIEKRPLLGNGYNTLRQVKFQEGMISDLNHHAATGSDSSNLTILATTGILGLLPFLWLQFTILQLSWKNSKKNGLALGLLGGFLALFIHSFFVNSLLFPQIMIYLWISLGCGLKNFEHTEGYYQKRNS